MGRAFAASFFLLIAACGPPAHRYRVDRAALVPVAVPDGAVAPAGETTEVTVSHHTVLWARPPEEPPGANVGLYVPRHQPGWMVRWRPRYAKAGSLTLDLRGGCEVGLVASSYRLADNGMEPAGEALVYWGGWGFSQRFASGLQWSWSTDVMIADVASRIRMTCLDCAGPGDDVTTGVVRDGIAGARSQLAVGIRRDAVELAIIGALRNQPHNIETHDEDYTDSGEAGSAMVTGDVFPIAGAALAIHPHPLVTIGGTVFVPYDPQGRSVRYGPIVGASLTIRAPQKKKEE